MLKPYLNKIGGTPTKVDSTTFGGGVNTTTNKAFIRDDQMSFSLNMAIYDGPTITTRMGRKTLATYMNATSLEDYADNCKHGAFCMLSIGQTLYAIEESSTSSNHYELVSYTFTQGLSVTRRIIHRVEKSKYYYMCECRTSNETFLIISNKNTRYMYKINADEFTECTDGYAGIVVCHKQRLFIAQGNHLYYSKTRQYDTFEMTDTDIINSAGEIQATWSEGDITGLASYDNKLVILFENSRALLYGYTADTTQSNAFQLVSLNDGIGCANPHAVTVLSNYLYWADRDMNIYRFNGSSTLRISEPYNTTSYTRTASYGGIKGIGYSEYNKANVRLSGYDKYLYVSANIYKNKPIHTGEEREELKKPNIVYVYDTGTRVWWAEDGEFDFMASLTPDSEWVDTELGTDSMLLGSMRNGDIVFINANKNANADLLFRPETRDIIQKRIPFIFETKTYLLGNVRRTKTITRVWFDAYISGSAGVWVSSSWNNRDSWDIEDNYGLTDDFISLGQFNQIKLQDDNDGFYALEGQERQCFNVPRMFFQRVNAFNFKVKGDGHCEFFLMEKEWRVR